MEELILEFAFRFILIIPGATIRWAFGGFKKPFKAYIDNLEANIFIGLAVVFAIVMLAFFLSR
jgi:hypothetical protein